MCLLLESLFPPNTFQSVDFWRAFVDIFLFTLGEAQTFRLPFEIDMKILIIHVPLLLRPFRPGGRKLS